jgi:CIC family chloride channel protein
MFELTGEYQIILPLMLAIALAACISKLVARDTIYTRKLLRRGIDLHAPERALSRLTVASAARPLPAPLAPNTDLAGMARRFADEPGDALPVIDAARQLRGVVLAIEVQRALTDQAEAVTAADLAQSVPVLHPQQGLEDALAELTRHGGAGLPVAGPDGTVTGWLTHRDLLHAAAGIRPRHPRPRDGTRRPGRTVTRIVTRRDGHR